MKSLYTIENMNWQEIQTLGDLWIYRTEQNDLSVLFYKILFLGLEILI